MKKGKGFLDILKKAYSSGNYCIVHKDESHEGCKGKSLKENKITVEHDGKEKSFEIDQITMKNLGGGVYYTLKTERDKKENKQKQPKKDSSKKLEKENKPKKEKVEKSKKGKPSKSKAEK